jgi:DNA-binding response OmpR family regulator
LRQASSRDAAVVVCEDPSRIRELARRHALVLAVLGPNDDVARALDLGAAAVVRAGAPAELEARVRALRRRAAQQASCSGQRLLLGCLASDVGRLFTKAELRAAIWGEHPPPAAGRALEAQVARLRRNLGPDGPALVTVWGVGYRLERAVGLPR